MSLRRAWSLLALLLALLAPGHAQQAASSCPHAQQAASSCPHSQRGHLQPFGHHARQWRRVENRYDTITAEEFYAEYVRPSKPVVVRGGIADWPAVEKWPNMTYLAELGGENLLEVDWRRIYDYDGDRAHLAHAMRRQLTMKDYISRLGKENVYMDTPLTEEMFKDIKWPQVTNCEYFIKRMRAPSFFFNDGKSSTDIHIDGTETLFFQVSGQRLWLMTPPENARYMYSGQEYFQPHSGISKVNQHSVDFKEFPNMQKAVIYAAVVNPGDLVYVPEAWFHNVKARGNPNQATTIFFDSSDCEKIFAEENDASFVVSCDKHRSIFLPPMIECPNKMPPGATFYDVFKKYAKENPKLTFHRPEKLPRREQRIAKFLKSKFWNRKVGNTRLPAMALNAEMEPFLASFKNKSTSILETKYSLLSLQPQDIPPLARHLQRFGVPRKRLQLLLTLPAAVSGRGAEAALAWLQQALAGFGAFPVGAIDLLLMEAPECAPASAEAQDCERDAAIDEHRLATWAALVAWQREGRVRLLGVKDASAAELRRLHAAFPGSVSVASFRFDPLYRQVALQRAAKELKVAQMVHSVTGSGYARLGRPNPLLTLDDLLIVGFGRGGSLTSLVHEWVLRRGLLLHPERVRTEERGELELPFVHFLVHSAGSELDQAMRPLVPEDRDYPYASDQRS